MCALKRDVLPNGADMSAFLLESISDDALLLDGWDASDNTLKFPSSCDIVEACTADELSLSMDGSLEDALVVVKTEPIDAQNPLDACIKQEPSLIKEERIVLPPASTASSSSSQNETTDDEKNLTPLEIRRKRNRESMQRARQRQREDVEQMKLTLNGLVKKFQKLSDDARVKRERGPAARSRQELETKYYALADLSHMLQAEKFMLQHMVREQQKTHIRVQQIMLDQASEDAAANALMGEDEFAEHEKFISAFEFAPITEDKANEVIRRCYQKIQSRDSTAKPLAHWDFDTGPTSASTFGWSVSCEITTGHNFFVSFTKSFSGLTAEEAMQQSWTKMSRPRKFFSPSRRVVRHEILQVINDSTNVVASDVQHPVMKDMHMRTIVVRFRLQNERGFVVGHGSLMPPDPEQHQQHQPSSFEDCTYEYVDTSTWIEFSNDPEAAANGNTGCVISFKTLTQYNTQENIHLRLINSLCMAWRWENSIIQPSKMLLQS